MHYFFILGNHWLAWISNMQTGHRKPPKKKHDRFVFIFFFLHALAWNQDFTVCYHNYCLIMLIVAYLTFCSTGESSVHPWLAAHCTRIYRSSPRHCERAAGWKFPRGSEGVGANMCWWMHVAQWERSWFSCLFSCLERRNFWFPPRFVVSSSSVLLVFRRSEQSVRLTFDLCLHLIRTPLGRFSVLLCLVLKTTRRHKVLLPVGHETIMQRQTFLHKSLHMMSFTACSLLLNCQVLHLLLWLIRICLSASSPRVFYRLECPVRCKLFFSPRFVKSQHSLSHICLMKMLINRAPVLHIGPFNMVKFFIAINYLLHWSCNMFKSSIDPATCLNLSLLHLYFLLSRLNTSTCCLFLVLLKSRLYLFWKSLGDFFSSNAKLLSVTQWLQINEDLEGEVRFASAVGPFAVPLRCTIKKCDVSEFLQGHHKVMAITSKLLLILSE